MSQTAYKQGMLAWDWPTNYVIIICMYAFLLKITLCQVLALQFCSNLTLSWTLLSLLFLKALAIYIFILCIMYFATGFKQSLEVLLTPSFKRIATASESFMKWLGEHEHLSVKLFK